MHEAIYYLGFSVFPGIGPVKFAQLLKYFGSAKAAWNASVQKLLQAKIGEKVVHEFDSFRADFSLADYEKDLSANQVSYVTLADEKYPKLLRKITNPPYILYLKGNLDLLQEANSERLLAVVGTRKITDYGRQVTETLTTDLSRAGYIIVSGLALGVDAIAHKSTVDADGKTIAVLGCGIDCCNPRENTWLYSEILSNNGLIVSEYGLGIAPTKGSFPSRNRIIAGLSLGVLVTEGAEDSGSLITANYGFYNNRKVFAVPGPITSSVSRGPISLITKGAKIVTNAEDILAELELERAGGTRRTKRVKGDTKEEQVIIDLLWDQDLHFDELVKRSDLDPAQMGTLLSLMEMKGMILPRTSGIFGLAE